MAEKQLHPIEGFKTEAEFSRVLRQIQSLVSTGKLKADGLDPSEPSFFVQKYVTEKGETWLLAMPDQAFRGYLRRV